MTLGRILNRLLRPLNLRVGTLTAEGRETARLRTLESRGRFDQPVFPLPRSVRQANPQAVLDLLPHFAERFETFHDASRNDVGYCYANDYFSSPDAEVLYTLIRLYRPATLIEVGSGHSTRVARQAIKDGNLATQLVSIDPEPRLETAGFADLLVREPVEHANRVDLFRSLGRNDILFIDSTHIAKPASDVVYLLLELLPGLAPGVIVHIHDVFLPYEYPSDWAIERRYAFNEQYLLQAMLAFGDSFSVLWPGYHLQRTLEGFRASFPHLQARRAQSFWMRKET